MEKDFTAWHVLKTDLQAIDARVFFHERDIWLCSIGINLGHEEDGKRERFLRPVVIFRKFNPDLFWGILLTSRIRIGSYYYQFRLDGRISTAMLFQMRLFDRKRLLRKMGMMPNRYFEPMKEMCMALIP